MKPIYFCLFTLIAYLSQPAIAITLSDHRCINAPVPQVIHAITDYSHYSEIPEANFTLMGYTALRMTQSTEIRKNRETSEDALVYIELMPLNFGADKRKLFPRFFIRCQVSYPSSTTALHECHSLTSSDLSDYHRRPDDPNAPTSPMAPFGVSNFHSTLRIASTPECQSELDYALDIGINPSDSAKIEAASAFKKFPISEDLFFKSYYQHFYDGWAKGIRSRD
jgi:hypothetical protein